MRLIIIDGLDGVGKDTHAQLIKERYEKKEERVILRSHPASDNFFGVKAKEALLKEGWFARVKAVFFFTFDVLRSIKKYYDPNKKGTLIMVRYLLGPAYLPLGLVKIGYKIFYNFVPTSEYMFYLDADPEILLERVKKRGVNEMFENLEEFKKVRRKALMLVKNWYRIDTSGSIEDTFSKIEKILSCLDEKNG